MKNGRERKRVAVVGAGVAGIVASHLIQQKHEVTLFERNAYVGGHTRTWVLAEGPDAGTPVDTGFIVFNDRTYPNFEKFLASVGAARKLSDMSFSCCDETSGLAYSGSGIPGLFARGRYVFSPSHWKFIAGIVRFTRRARLLHLRGDLAGITLGEFCRREKIPAPVVDNYVLPMASAIWSSPFTGIREFPMDSLARFYENHGLLSFTDRPTWYTVEGGSHAYVKLFLEKFTGTVKTGTPVVRVARGGNGVRVETRGGDSPVFDAVVLAAHADEALAMLADPGPRESALLGAWEYSRNRVVLHTDGNFLPPVKRARASWNYLRFAGSTGDDPACLTYYMNRLQGIRGAVDYLVTLNPPREIRKEKIIAEFLYDHPVYTPAAVATQKELPGLNGTGNVYFCGSYFNNGFHEDAVTAAVEAARHFGCSL